MGLTIIFNYWITYLSCYRDKISFKHKILTLYKMSMEDKDNSILILVQLHLIK
jgi:hypothetical protein